MQLKAYAKLNLALEILDLRPDGYHNLRSVMQTISLADTLTVQRSDALTLSVPGRRELETDDNLVLRAARLLGGGIFGARLILEKNIPQGAGLGGGSADAAAALKALNEFWGLSCSLPHLEGLAASLGSDVPFFLTGGTCEVGGRGEVVKPLPESDKKYWYVLLHPPFAVSTAWAYRAFDENPIPPSGFTEKVKEALAFGDVEILAGAIGNNLEQPVFAGYPKLGRYKKELFEAGALGAVMSGSGSTIFGLFASEAEAMKAKMKLLERLPELEINIAYSMTRSEIKEQEKELYVENFSEEEVRDPCQNGKDW